MTLIISTYVRGKQIIDLEKYIEKVTKYKFFEEFGKKMFAVTQFKYSYKEKTLTFF